MESWEEARTRCPECGRARFGSRSYEKKLQLSTSLVSEYREHRQGCFFFFAFFSRG